MSPTTLADLPAELLVKITDNLPLNDRCALGATNSRFREFLAPTLFSNVKVSNEDPGLECITDFCTKYGRHIQHVSFECHLHPNWQPVDSWLIYSAGLQQVTTPRELPQELQDLLCGRTLPKVRSFRIVFLPDSNYKNSHWDPQDEGDGGIMMHQCSESWMKVEDREAQYAWRSIYAQTFGCLASNRSVTALEIVDLPPKVCSTFWSEEWNEFLERLGKFSLGVWGGDNGAGWQSNTLGGYLMFIQLLHVWFFEHLESVEEIRFVADATSPAGCEGLRHAPLPLAMGFMPMLETLELWNCFIDPALIQCLEGSSATIKTLRFVQCYSASGSNLAADAITWAELFDFITRKSLPITEVSIVNSKVPLTGDEQSDWEPTEEELKTVQAIREALKSDEKRRLFPYAMLDDKYGLVYQNDEQNVVEFEAGGDQRAWDALMEMVRRNREEQGLPPTWEPPALEDVSSTEEERRTRRGIIAEDWMR